MKLYILLNMICVVWGNSCKYGWTCETCVSNGCLFGITHKFPIGVCLKFEDLAEWEAYKTYYDTQGCNRFNKRQGKLFSQPRGKKFRSETTIIPIILHTTSNSADDIIKTLLHTTRKPNGFSKYINTTPSGTTPAPIFNITEQTKTKLKPNAGHPQDDSAKIQASYNTSIDLSLPTSTTPMLLLHNLQTTTPIIPTTHITTIETVTNLAVTNTPLLSETLKQKAMRSFCTTYELIQLYNKKVKHAIYKNYQIKNPMRKKSSECFKLKRTEIKQHCKTETFISRLHRSICRSDTLAKMFKLSSGSSRWDRFTNASPLKISKSLCSKLNENRLKCT